MQIRKHFLFLAFSAVILFSGISQIYGQRVCGSIVGYQDSPYWRANFVFTGVVEKFSVKDEQFTISEQPRHTFTKFAVEKNYRGDIGKSVEISSEYFFKEGERYFVYASRSAQGKIYLVDSYDGTCGKPPILLEDAKDDIEYAEEIAEGKPGTQISGFVFEDFQRLGTGRQNIPLAGVEVTIKKGKTSFTTRTDEKGKYIFKNIPPGEYKISSSTPKGLREKTPNEFYFDQRGLKRSVVLVGETTAGGFMMFNLNEKPKKYYRHWDSYNFVFTSLSSIAGKAVDADGKVPQQQYVWLIPKFKGKIDLNDNLRQVWTDRATGEFVFEGIPQGEYLIAVNRYNCHSNNHPEYGRNFFPGAADLDNAELITVSENQNLKIKDFRLSPPLKERSFTGVVLTPDKKPLANAVVFLMTTSQSTPNECFSVNLETKTDAFGRFEIKGYEGYEYKIRAYIEPTEQNSSRLISKIIDLQAAGNVQNIELIVDSNY
jgi:hypothetical protein